MTSGQIKLRDGSPCWYFAWSNAGKTKIENLDEILDWCNAQFGPGAMFGADGRVQRWGQGLSTFFFTNLEDALMFRLTWDN